MNNPSNPVHLTLPNLQPRTSIHNINMNCRHVFWCLSRHASNSLLLDQVLLCCPIFRLFYYTSYHIYPCILSSTFPNITSSSSTCNLWPARWGITIHRRIKKHTLKQDLGVHLRRQPIVIADEMFELRSQPAIRVLDIADVSTAILMNQDDDDTDRDLGKNASEDPGELTVLSDIEEDDSDTQQEILHPDQVPHDKTIQTTIVPLLKIRSHAETVIAHTSLSNLRHPARAIAPPLLKCKESTIDILHESAIVPTQALPLPKAGGDQYVPQPNAHEDHNIPQHQKATFEVSKWFVEAIAFTKTPWPIISNVKYSTVDKAWILVIEAQDCQQALAGGPEGTPSVCQWLGGPFRKIDWQTGEAVSDYSVLRCSIGLMMIQNPNNIHI